jgi:hypothetical protein
MKRHQWVILISRTAFQCCDIGCALEHRNRGDSLSGALEMMDSYDQMLRTLINNTLYGSRKWQLAEANTHRIVPDALEEY